MNTLSKQRESYVQQLQQTETRLQTLDVERQRLITQREQLKGAIFALDSLSQTEGEPTTESPESPESTATED